VEGQKPVIDVENKIELPGSISSALPHSEFSAGELATLRKQISRFARNNKLESFSTIS
jgi:hypothetical protein